ncbi:disease resistance protein Roq1 [Cryptomeria japonica]|uniref:disease resistance protein Roq1 n=1 Tax=Cryptomeria japonica TaxID=3369 RepID=UPI0027DA4DA5|nr:disease resistance protein Roq1 [Cryptomeria japonica]
MASSSSYHQSKKMKSSASHVFISHRSLDQDVEESLAVQLYRSLQKVSVQAFFHSEEMELGDLFPLSTDTAIRSASVQIAIFSKGYAESAWCLTELVLMLQTKATIIPVFYDVRPSDLHDIEKGAYANAFKKFEEQGMYLEKLEEWKQALRSVSLRMAYYDFNKPRHNRYALCKKLVAAVLKEIEKKKHLKIAKIPLPFDEIVEEEKRQRLDVAKYPIGLEEIVKDFETEFKQDKTTVIGIYGMAGSGKTTLAKQLFNLYRSQYDRSCFLFDVRESDSVSLESKLVIDLFHGDFKGIPNDEVTEEGISDISTNLRKANFPRFLVVLDDVHDVLQLNALLAKAALKSDSLAIVTTRDQSVLKAGGIDYRYEMKPLSLHDSMKLFSWYAFHQSSPESGYEDLVRRFAMACDGSPLSLGLLGGHVFGRDKCDWELELSKIDKCDWELELSKFHPEEKNLMHILKISFDALDKEVKQIFMDTACFFIGHSKAVAVRIWEGSGWNAGKALQILEDKSLVEVVIEEMDDECRELEYDEKHILRMPAYLRDFAWEMADARSSPLDRLWRTEDLKSWKFSGFQKILIETSGKQLRCFNSTCDWSIRITYFLGNSRGYSETVLLWLELDLRDSFLTSIPPWIPLQNLQGLKVSNGGLKRLWQNDNEAQFQLRRLVLYTISAMEDIKSIEMVTTLEDLVLSGDLLQTATTVMEGNSLSDSLRKLHQLRYLVLRHFTLNGELYLSNERKPFLPETPMSSLEKMEIFPPKPSINSLEKIEITKVELMSKVFISGEYCYCLKHLKLSDMEDLSELNLIGVKTLHSLKIEYCTELKTVLGISDLKILVMLYLRDCPKLEMKPTVANMLCLEEITIDNCRKLQNLEGIEELQGLKYLHISKVHRPILVTPMWNAVHSLQRLPPVISVIGIPVNEAESLTANLFNGVTSPNMTVSEIPSASLNMTQPLGAIIVCAVIECEQECNVVEIPLSANYSTTSSLPLPGWKREWRHLPAGEWIISIAIAGGYASHYITQSSWISNKGHNDPKIKKGFIVTPTKDEEGEIIHLFKKIINQLYYPTNSFLLK